MDITLLQNVSADITLEKWLIKWLEYKATDDIKSSTYVSYEGYIKNHLSDIGNLRLKDLDLSCFQSFVDDLSAKMISAKTIRNIFVVLKAALNMAVALDIINTNYAKYVKLPRYIKEEIIVLSPTEQEMLIKASLNSPFGVFIRFTLCTGLRLGELLGLFWSDVNFDSNKIHIRRTLTRTKNLELNAKTATVLKFTYPKTANAVRTICVPQEAMNDLKQWKEYQNSIFGETDLVVCNSVKKPLEQKAFTKKYKEIKIIAGITNPKVNWHTLRHTFATRALEKGMDIKTLSSVLGHYSTRFTLDTYAHILDSFQRQQMQLMSDIYSSKKDVYISLKFSRYQNQYIVSVLENNKYTWISNSVEEAIKYLKSISTEMFILSPILPETEKSVLNNGEFIVKCKI